MPPKDYRHTQRPDGTEIVLVLGGDHPVNV
jgi:hypothetical protein